MTPGRGNIFLFCFSQQLPRLHLGPLKGFLGWHGALQGPLTLPCALLPELQSNKDAARCAALCTRRSQYSIKNNWRKPCLSVRTKRTRFFPYIGGRAGTPLAPPLNDPLILLVCRAALNVTPRVTKLNFCRFSVYPSLQKCFIFICLCQIHYRTISNTPHQTSRKMWTEIHTLWFLICNKKL